MYTHCVPCAASTKKKWMERNGARYSAYIKTYLKTYYQEHKEELQSKHRAWKASHPEWTKTYYKQRAKRLEDSIREQRSEHYKNNRSRIRAAQKSKYEALSPEDRHSQYGRLWLIRRSRKQGSLGSFTAEEWKAIKRKFKGRCAHPGCNRTDITVDHIIPLSKGGCSFAFNLQPLCKSHNCSKKARLLTSRVSLFDKVSA